MAQAELNLGARDRFTDSHRLVPASDVTERCPELEIVVDEVAYYPVCLLDGTKPSVAAVRLLEIGGAHRHGWALALWLDAPNRWLAGRPPVEILETDGAAVERALRLELPPVG